MPRRLPNTLSPARRGLLRAPDAAAWLSIGRSAFYKAVKSGIIPAPVTVEKINLWRTGELIDWIAAGCPPAVEWRWRPSLVVKLEDAIELRSKQIVELSQDLERLLALLAKGEKLVSTRRE